MTVQSQPLVFECEGSQLLAVIDQPRDPRDVGVLIVTGGPQYRVGSHRQFVGLARSLAAKGIPTLRFDYRGMGDSAGPAKTFDQCSADLRAAVDTFVTKSSIQNVILLGLCDAASACLIYGYTDSRVVGQVLLNPWVRTDAGLAQAYVKHYYLNRLATRAFWAKLLSGRFKAWDAVKEFGRNVGSTLRLLLRIGTANDPAVKDTPETDFRSRMLSGFRKFDGQILFLFCGADLTAAEFINFTKQSKGWDRPMSRESVTQLHLPGMDHTFSTRSWRMEIVDRSIRWIDEYFPAAERGTADS
jgi:exosortase A-associated hydrolase 1